MSPLAYRINISILHFNPVIKWGQMMYKEYFKYNKKYQLYERQQEISDALEQLQI